MTNYSAAFKKNHSDESQSRKLGQKMTFDKCDLIKQSSLTAQYCFFLTGRKQCHTCYPVRDCTLKMFCFIA